MFRNILKINSKPFEKIKIKISVIEMLPTSLIRSKKCSWGFILNIRADSILYLLFSSKADFIINNTKLHLTD